MHSWLNDKLVLHLIAVRHFTKPAAHKAKLGTLKLKTCVGLLLLGDKESKVVALRKAIQDGVDSGIAYNFYPKKHFQELKARKLSNCKV